jgi:hypothetical protein
VRTPLCLILSSVISSRWGLTVNVARSDLSDYLGLSPVGSENSIHWVSIAGKSEHDCWMFAIAFLFVRVLCDLCVPET